MPDEPPARPEPARPEANAAPPPPRPGWLSLVLKCLVELLGG